MGSTSNSKLDPYKYYHHYYPLEAINLNLKLKGWLASKKAWYDDFSDFGRGFAAHPFDGSLYIDGPVINCDVTYGFRDVEKYDLVSDAENIKAFYESFAEEGGGVSVQMLNPISEASEYASTISIGDVLDGDTLYISNAKIRLYGIDAPELSQSYGIEAKEELENMKNDIVTVDTYDIDIYGRTVAVLYKADGTSINEELVKKGAAWVFIDFCSEDFCDTWKSYEDDARAQGLGLWAEDSPQPPWEYRNED